LQKKIRKILLVDISVIPILFTKMRNSLNVDKYGVNIITTLIFEEFIC
jgi:hypothetical protein